MKSKRYDMGGSLQSLLPLLDLAAPGLGTAASTVAGVLQQANAFNKQTTPLKSPTNPFRSYKLGGKLKEHNLPTHEQGGGMVDKMGNPSNQGTAEIEKQESIYTSQKGKTPYVFSDTLVDSNGKTFSQNAKSVEKKFNGKDQISKTTHKKLMDELMAKNEIARKLEESQIDGTNEQEVPKFDPGGYLTNPEMTNLIDQRRVTSGYQDLLGNIRSGAFPRIGRAEAVVPGSNRILDNVRGGVQSQTPINTGLPSQPETPSIPKTTNPLGSLDLGSPVLIGV